MKRLLGLGIVLVGVCGCAASPPAAHHAWWLWEPEYLWLAPPYEPLLYHSHRHEAGLEPRPQYVGERGGRDFIR